MLKSIETQSFKKLDNFKADFTSGTNLILGENGRGKTTIFNVVRFALFGTAAIASSSDNIPTWGENSCKVKVHFDDFLVVRTLRDCKIYQENEMGVVQEDNKFKVAEGNKPCSLWIKDKLALDYKMFSIFAMSMQGETGALITLGATELNRIVEKFSGVEVLDKVIKSLSKEVSSLEGALGTVEYLETTECENEVTSLTDKVTLLSAELGELSSKKDQLENERSDCFSRYSKAVDHNDKVSELQSRKSLLENNLSTFNSRIAEYLKTLEELGEVVDVEHFKSEALRIKAQLDEFNSDSNLHSKLEVQIDNAGSKMEEYLKRAKLQSQSVSLKKELDLEIQEKTSVLEKAGEVVASTRAKLSDVQKELKELRTKLKDGICPKCNRPIENFDPESVQKEIDEKQEVVKSLGEQLDSEDFDYAEIKTELTKLNQNRNAIKDYGNDNEELAENQRAEIEQLSRGKNDLEEKWDSFDEEYESGKLVELNSKVSSADRTNKQIASVKQNLEQVRESKVKTETELETLVIEDRIDTTEFSETLTNIDNQLEVVYEKLRQKMTSKSDYEQKLQFAKRTLEDAQKQNERFSEYSEGIDKAKRLSKFLKQSRTEYMENVWVSILGVASEFINRTTNGWITAVGRNDKGDFTFTENGIEAPAYSEASGAQKEFIGVAIRIGLSSCLKGDSATMMLDEPTAGMSEDNADKLATGLLGVSGQKIIITHRRSERLTAANIINL